ncbi:hypothetical protein SAMN05443550_103168 [Pedobacter hartonius]|uniref:Alpha-rhamnosidase-like N-terminal domain-containing protein n=2 Tax=Pedobacter hartonius TaxID=425514 RepID=A0A1H4B0Y5_9SPHI|nr:hypothetical protein SAMN05443550_103168 [Pedobacter hartonius]
MGGRCTLNLKVFCQNSVPAIFVQGKKVISDASWMVTFEDKEWIDQSGKASDQSGTAWLNAASWNFNDPASPPSAFKLLVKAQSAVTTEKKGQSLLLDFGKETFGFIKFQGLKGKGVLSLYYGESKEEALATAQCETLDKLDISLSEKKDTLTQQTKAFCYVTRHECRLRFNAV